MLIKSSNEVTLKIASSSVEEFIECVKEKGLKEIERFNLNDDFFIPKDLDIDNLTTREILSHAILLRRYNNITFDKSKVWLVYKEKIFDEEGNILEQSSTKLEILDEETAKIFLNKIGYKLLINIYEDDIVFENEKLCFALKNVRNGEKLIESETEDNEYKDSVEKIISNLKEINIPLDYSNWYVKKAELEVNKLLGRI